MFLVFFWGGRPYHRGEDRQEEGGGGRVAGALGKGGNQQTQDERYGKCRDISQWRQFPSQPFRQSRGLVRDTQTGRHTHTDTYNVIYYGRSM